MIYLGTKRLEKAKKVLDPQTINPLTLPSVPLSERSQLPATPCIYLVLSQSGEILYVGRSVNLQQRLRTGHHRYSEFLGVGAHRVAWFACDAIELENIESQLIDLLKPKLNNQPHSDYPGKVVSRLADYRKRKGLSQDELARLSGLTKTTIQNWENGRNLGAVVRVLKVCQELGVDIRELFEEEKAGDFND